jgi:hypothetical protein
MPDGTWHVFPDGGGWAHYTSKDLIHWNVSHPTTNFDGDTGAITVTPAGTFALWPTKHGEGCGRGGEPGDNASVPGVCMAVSSGPALRTFEHRGLVGNRGDRDTGVQGAHMNPLRPLPYAPPHRLHGVF